MNLGDLLVTPLDSESAFLEIIDTPHPPKKNQAPVISTGAFTTGKGGLFKPSGIHHVIVGNPLNFTFE